MGTRQETKTKFKDFHFEKLCSFIPFYLENKTRKVSRTIYQLDRSRRHVNYTSLKSEHLSTVWLAVYMFWIRKLSSSLRCTMSIALQEIYAVLPRAAVVKQGSTHWMVLRVWNSCSIVLNIKSQAIHVSEEYWFFQDLQFYNSSTKENQSHLSTGLITSGVNPQHRFHQVSDSKTASEKQQPWEWLGIPTLLFPHFHFDRNYHF